MQLLMLLMKLNYPTRRRRHRRQGRCPRGSYYQVSMLLCVQDLRGVAPCHWPDRTVGGSPHATLEVALEFKCLAALSFVDLVEPQFDAHARLLGVIVEFVYQSDTSDMLNWLNHTSNRAK